MQFVDLVVAVHRALKDARVPHAFGGALALGYIASPRGTVDIDVNVFVSPEEMDSKLRHASSVMSSDARASRCRS